MLRKTSDMHWFALKTIGISCVFQCFWWKSLETLQFSNLFQFFPMFSNFPCSFPIFQLFWLFWDLSHSPWVQDTEISGQMSPDGSLDWIPGTLLWIRIALAWIQYNQMYLGSLSSHCWVLIYGAPLENNRNCNILDSISLRGLQQIRCSNIFKGMGWRREACNVHGKQLYPGAEFFFCFGVSSYIGRTLF